MLDKYMLNENTIKREKIIKEMQDYALNNPKDTIEYKQKYQEYLYLLNKTEITDDYFEDEIDIAKYKNSPYLRLKYWVSEYVTYYYKILKREKFVITKKINIELDIDNVDELIKTLDLKIKSLKNEELINYILNLNNIITSKLKS